MANTTHELSKRPVRVGGSYPVGTPLDDVFVLDDEPLHEFAFSVSHHRASERGRMAAAGYEYGTAAMLDEGGF